jgi:hypothetical protein
MNCPRCGKRLKETTLRKWCDCGYEEIQDEKEDKKEVSYIG